MSLRSTVALLLLISFTVSSLEAVAGVVRDGAVHHETNAAALSHAVDAAGEHGHESVEEGSQQEHGPEHRHGTSSDHCTHTHTSGLTASAIHVAWVVSESPVVALPPATPTDRTVRPLLQPPRA